MPVLTLSDGSVLSFVARARSRLEPQRQDELLQMLDAPEARQVALVLLKREDAGVAADAREAARQLEIWADSF